jgi:hypothetical protein
VRHSRSVLTIRLLAFSIVLPVLLNPIHSSLHMRGVSSGISCHNSCHALVVIHSSDQKWADNLAVSVLASFGNDSHLPRGFAQSISIHHERVTLLVSSAKVLARRARNVGTTAA